MLLRAAKEAAESNAERSAARVLASFAQVGSRRRSLASGRRGGPHFLRRSGVESAVGARQETREQRGLRRKGRGPPPRKLRVKNSRCYYLLSPSGPAYRVTTPTHVSVALRDLLRRHVSGRGHVGTVCSGLRQRLPPGVAFAVISRSPAGSMEDEEEEARALLPGGSDEAGRETRAPPAASGALQALCDPSHLAHRLVVLLLMCFLGFGEPAGLVGWEW